MEFTTAEQRNQDTGIKGVIYGASGIGKTSLLYTLPETETLVGDLESGMIAVKDWKGDALQIRDWRMARAFAGLVGGVNPASIPGQPYSLDFLNSVKAYFHKQGVEINMDKYTNVFVDSITVASRLCMQWVLQQPECMTNQGKLDKRKAYGLLKEEMVAWLMQLQHAKGKNVWFVGILDQKDGDNGKEWKPQMEGASVADALRGIVDQVVTLAEVGTKDADGNIVKRRAFINHTINPWQYPAKDRSGTLNMAEPAHLGKLMEKIKTGSRHNPNFDMAEFLSDEIVF